MEDKFTREIGFGKKIFSNAILYCNNNSLVFLKTVLRDLNNYVILLRAIESNTYCYRLKAIFIVTVAIKKLFDIRIFGCARGDFSSGRPLVVYRNIRKPSLEAETMCECVQLLIPGIIKHI